MKKISFGILFFISSIVWAAPDWIKAQVVKVEPERHRIVLNHENIKSVGMNAMTMLFDTSPKLDLKSYKVGDSVRFQIKINDGVLEVIALVSLYGANQPIAGNERRPRLMPTLGIMPICGSLGVRRMETVVMVKTTPTSINRPGVKGVKSRVTPMIPEVIEIRISLFSMRI